MTLLKQDPSAQRPCAKTMLGLPGMGHLQAEMVARSRGVAKARPYAAQAGGAEGGPGARPIMGAVSFSGTVVVISVGTGIAARPAGVTPAAPDVIADHACDGPAMLGVIRIAAGSSDHHWERHSC